MKKIIALVACLSLVASLAVGGSIAYLTDRASEVNTFTIGNVKIGIEENFEDDTLNPGVELTKEAKIVNTGDNDAWVWMSVEVEPSDMAEYIHLTFGDDWIKKDENTYLYEEARAKGEETSNGLLSVMLDGKIYADSNGDLYLPQNGVQGDALCNINDLKVIVNAYAIQAEGFGNVNDAYEAYKGQWGEDGGAEGDNEDDNSDADVTTVTNNEELAAALNEGKQNIVLSEGTFQMPSAAQGKTFTLTGAGKDKTIIEVVPGGQNEANGQLDYNLDGSNVTFNDLQIKTNSQLYAGYARLSGTYNNCLIQNTYNLGIGNSKFTECEFNITNEYLRVGGAYSAEFDKCTFNTDGRAILVFQDGTNNDQTVTVKDCTFNATAAAQTWNGIHVAAVSIDGSQGGTYVVNLEGTNTVDSDFNGLWQIKDQNNNVIVK